MTLPGWHEEPISKSHDRASFDCGDEQMNDFLRRFARQSHEQNASKTFCAVDGANPSRILGFYTIAPSAVAHEQVPATLTKGLARHEVSGFKLARLATDLTVTGQGLGGQLLAAAALRCLRVAAESGGLLLIIDAKSERAASWYRGYGAEPLLERPLTLVMPLASFAADFSGKGLL
ncbi:MULTISPECIES: GNAT family N-acetyltransferase [unclassified Mesorhizobium]|uniref:GNAT family N-acetyltransferase n=1 Tax=unclassified Mesorhizobium TaxID=325217 RepID=UPI001CCEF5D5|nr:MULTISPECIES: GNAT family N-acetyltransferase [unclassified Mesorhizobium]MBZ9736805.1 GNAT family N-acetyltransferase [Mesorhizobium sp. CA9]MBZ9767151.1 GNAT family N-acetyltransferase [Mesorhizobium sp. CA6]MBZ9825348.1 GNAT family N-acetyltransferase [Mesorhizobium sp. CA18]MBZ9834077.1 GNAT family N-acetyltransferase [Mesorhizobium sp. CA2]MBZ9836459.1 GNAT family N-acetyltransferase [Mesorhizobium sp. CA3]